MWRDWSCCFPSWILRHLGGFFIKRKLDHSSGKGDLYKCILQEVKILPVSYNSCTLDIEQSLSMSLVSFMSVLYHSHFCLPLDLLLLSPLLFFVFSMLSNFFRMDNILSFIQVLKIYFFKTTTFMVKLIINRHFWVKHRHLLNAGDLLVSGHKRCLKQRFDCNLLLSKKCSSCPDCLE